MGSTWVIGLLESDPIDLNELKPYTFDFTPFLQSDESVAGGSEGATSTGVTVDSTTELNGNIITVWLTGGTIGEKIEVIFTCTGDDATVPTTVQRSVFFYVDNV